MAAASDVTFDVLLGGKVTPQLLKSFKDLEELMKKQGATAKTINAVMGRAYSQTFDDMSKKGKKHFDEVEKSSKHAFHEIVEHAREAQKKVAESFEKMRESYDKFAELVKKPLEWIGITGVLGAAGGALGGAELIKKGIEVHRARETESATLQAILGGRGAGAQAGEWEEAAERIAQRARVGHDEAMKLMTKLAVSGRFNAEEAQRMAMSLIGLGGGTAEGAEAARAAYGKVSLMMMAGKVRPQALGAIAGGSGMGGALLQQLSRDTGIPVTDLAKQFAQAKVSKQGVVTGGALAGAKGIEALNKAIIELGESRGFELIKAKMTGMEGMFYRFGEHWEDFTNKIGEAFEDFISPIADRVNQLLDTINFEEVFKGMIDKAQEWGHLIAAVWDTIANAPVLNAVKAMWDDFWKHLTGGAELYGPFVETWNDNMNHALGTHMARHPTEAFYKLRTFIADELGGALNSAINAFKWFVDNLPSITDGLWAIAEAFIGMKIAELVINVGNLAKAVFALDTAVGTASSGAVGATILFVAWIGKLTDNMLKYLGTPEGKKMSSDLERARMHPGETAADIAAVGGYSTPAARAAAQQAVQYAARTNDPVAEAALRQVESLEKLNKLNDKVRQDQEKHNKAIQDATSALRGQSPGLIPAINDATAGLTAFAQTMAGFGSGFGAGGMFGLGGGDGVTGAHFTEYGPSVAGDQPGGPTYDWNSYHHVGAWPGVTGPLRAGDVALGYGAQSKYHVMPGQMFTDEYGRTWRFADRSGSKDPFNVDVFKGAMGGIFRKPTRAVIGESGPEAVLPLAGAGVAAAGLGGVTINVNVAGNAHDPEGIAEAVERVIRTHWRRQAVV